MAKLHMSLHINILRGTSFSSSSLSDYCEQKRFLHPIWVLKDEIKWFRDHHVLSEVYVLVGEKPCVVRTKVLQRAMPHFNIAQFNNPWKLFFFYLYHREVGFENTQFRFSAQIRFYKFAKKYSFTEKMWISKRQLKGCFMNDFPALPGAKHMTLNSNDIFAKEDRDFYNIQQLFYPNTIKFRIKYMAYSIFTGRHLPKPHQKALSETARMKNYKTSYWFMARERHKVELRGFRIKAEERPVTVYNRRHPIRYYHIESTRNPLLLQKYFFQNKEINRQFRDILGLRHFSYRDIRNLLKCKRNLAFRSDIWINYMDLLKVNAIVKDDEKALWTRCSNGEWYNLDQIENGEEVLSQVIQRKARRSGKTNSVADIFEKIIDPNEHKPLPEEIKI